MENVGNYVREHHMLSSKDVVVTGVSGGADSVCLLLVLSALKKEIPFRLLAVHVNHMIREEAGEDAAYVQELCGRMGVPFFLVQKNVTELSQTENLSLEEAGRQVRYAAFRDVLLQEAPEAFSEGRAKIAVAHNLNDRAETMLFHLFRGSGLSGLCSIRPVRENPDGSKVIRPLLSTSRRQIEDFLKGLGMGWKEDATNAGDHYTRNRIRHHLLPLAEREVCEGAVENMGRAADILSDTEDFVQREAAAAYAACVTKTAPERLVIPMEKFLQFHPVLQGRMLLLALEELAGAKKDITAAHIHAMLSLFKNRANRELSLPYGIRAGRVYGEVIMERAAGREDGAAGGKAGGAEGETLPQGMSILLPEPDGQSVEIAADDGTIFEFKVFTREKTVNIPQNQYTKWFDYDRIEKSLEIRTRTSGDYLTVNAAFSRKSVQDYMVNEKIPRQERDHIQLLADGSHILWVPGYRISTYYKINENTKHILQVQLRGGHRPCRSM